MSATSGATLVCVIYNDIQCQFVVSVDASKGSVCPGVWECCSHLVPT